MTNEKLAWPSEHIDRDAATEWVRSAYASEIDAPEDRDLGSTIGFCTETGAPPLRYSDRDGGSVLATQLR